MRKVLFIAPSSLSWDEIHGFQNKIESNISDSRIDADFFFIGNSIKHKIKDPLIRNQLEIVVFTEGCSYFYIKTLIENVMTAKIHYTPLLIIIGNMENQFCKNFNSIEEAIEYINKVEMPQKGEIF